MVYLGTCVLRYVDFKTMTNTVMASFVGFRHDDHLIGNVLAGGRVLFNERPAFEKKNKRISGILCNVHLYPAFFTRACL
jgi:hypothetical protein